MVAAADVVTHRQTLGSLVNQSMKWLLVTIGTIIFIIALLILFHQNATATKGYELRNLQRERTLLLQDDEAVRLRIADAQSFNVLEADAHIRSMVNPSVTAYAEPQKAVAEAFPGS